MPSGFGFNRPQLQPAPDPRAVGQQLMGQQQQQSQQPQQPQQPIVDDRQGIEVPLVTREANLRREGGKIMGGGGDDSDGALSAAVGEALTRAGGGHRGNPNPHKNREGHVRHLQRLGISEVEAQLLGETL